MKQLWKRAMKRVDGTRRSEFSEDKIKKALPEKMFAGVELSRLSALRDWMPYAACLVALALASSAVAQQGQNIAGNYRGLMTGCLSQERSADCRKGLTELIQLADGVDAQRIEWEHAKATGDASAAKLEESYDLALTRLNRAVADFNRNMISPPVQSK